MSLIFCLFCRYSCNSSSWWKKTTLWIYKQKNVRFPKTFVRSWCIEITKLWAWLVFVKTIINWKKQSLLYKSQFFIDIQKTQICYFLFVSRLKKRISSKYLIKKRFKRYRFKSAMPFYQLKVIWNYAYSPIRSVF